MQGATSVNLAEPLKQKPWTAKQNHALVPEAKR